MNPYRLLATGLLAGLLTAGPTRASEGHDHGPAAPATGGTASPRFTAVSDDFELVGVLAGRQLTLYLDRAADNRPVPGAAIELEIGGAKLKAAPQADATYQVMLAEAPKPGVLPVTATVTAGAETDLLAGELDLHAAESASADAAHRHGWHEVAPWAAAALLALVLAFWGTRRVLDTRRGTATRTGSAA